MSQVPLVMFGVSNILALLDLDELKFAYNTSDYWIVCA